ncbi:hypothetical protein JCM10908_003592 [Rhodotorula pacifica]|uniref:uncharacterized protein n=1 Tax=Rhodotorula pacifica TaxID=1495444 RepID=UPI00317678C3
MTATLRSRPRQPAVEGRKHVAADPRALADELIERVEQKCKTPNGRPQRYLVGLAGIPGSGKSTFSDALIQALNTKETRAALVPMDGFHRTQASLAADPDPAFSFRRRGAPFTFDPDAFLALVRRLRSEHTLTAPAFSHAAKDPVADAIRIDERHRIVLVEGSFLCLDEEPWRTISLEMDERWFYDVDEETALQRVIKRHIAAGLAADETAAEAKALANDVLNAKLILEKMVPPDESHPNDGPFPKPTPQLSDSVFDLFSMKGKVTAITGGGGGIGFAAAEAIAEAGGDIALLYRSAPNMEERSAELAKRFGVKVKSYQCEVTEHESVKQAIEAVEKDFGRLDCYIANAGGGVPGSINPDYPLEAWHKTQSVNLHSTFYAARECARIFKAQGSGSFIATTSISARIVNVPYDQPAYNSSKAAVVHFCKSLARDWRNFARVNTISPGFFDTPMGPSDKAVEDVLYQKSVLGRAGNVKELKAAYLYLASNASTYTTGADLIIDGGYCLT